ncbi:MAG: hypoxanthine phosphoribosyltransferase [Planctomycetes bacterium]|nr:hypoxanthine phosphoribosyltransferase [Planctomycetota bacterium]
MNPVPLIRAARIRGRVRQLGRELAGAFAGNPGRVPAIVALLDGSFCFVADLVRAIPVPDLRLHFARAASYHGGTVSSGSVTIDALPSCVGADVLVVDDILDTGRTLAAVVAALHAGGAARVRTCVLLDKPARRVPVDGVRLRADFVGFTIPDRFVVGYGLDHDGRYRHLPDVCVLDGVAIA